MTKETKKINKKPKTFETLFRTKEHKFIDGLSERQTEQEGV